MKRLLEKLMNHYFVVIVWLLFCLMFILLPFEHFNKSYVLDMSEYHGRIMPFQEFKGGALTVEVPIGDALRWGQDSIMIYNEEEMHIWRPDDKIVGMFQHASIETKKIRNHMYMWKIKVENNSIRLSSHYPFGWVLMWCMIFAVVLFGLWGPTFKKEEQV